MTIKLEDVFGYSALGAMVIVAIVLSPIWIPLYTIGRTVEYIYDKIND